MNLKTKKGTDCSAQIHGKQGLAVISEVLEEELKVSEAGR